MQILGEEYRQTTLLVPGDGHVRNSSQRSPSGILKNVSANGVLHAAQARGRDCGGQVAAQRGRLERLAGDRLLAASAWCDAVRDGLPVAGKSEIGVRSRPATYSPGKI